MTNEAVSKNAIFPELTLKKKHNVTAYHRTREAVAAGIMNLADVLTKLNPRRRKTFHVTSFCIDSGAKAKAHRYVYVAISVTSVSI